MTGLLRHRPWVLLITVAGLAACSGSDQTRGTAEGNAGGRSLPIKVVATTGMITDTAANVGGERVRVIGLMGPSVDPHLYKATQGDIALLAAAEVILYNGLHLEGKMGDILVKMARNRPTFAVTEDIPTERLREPPEFAGQHDPHVWFDVSLWRIVTRTIHRILTEVDPEGSGVYSRNADAYEAKLVELDAWARAQIATIPQAQRVLVTAHDAFGYFGSAYGIEVVGLQGISTLSDFGLRDVTTLVDLVTERRVKAVFVESSVNERAIRAVVGGCREKGWDVVIGGTLYSDAMGPAGTPEGTYLGMVRANVATIVDALSSVQGE